MNEFDHKALHLEPVQTVVFTAMSKRYFYMRYFVTKYVLERKAAPLNPFTSFDYFLLDTVERDVVRRANNTLLALADELWVFGDISDGVQAEIVQAKRKNIPIKYFKFKSDQTIVPAPEDDLVYEDGVR